MSPTRVDLVREGVSATKAEVGPFELQLLTFQPNHRIAPFDVERGYVDGVHASDFARVPTTGLAVRSRGDEDAFGVLLRRLRHVRAAASTAIGWRLEAELRAREE